MIRDLLTACGPLLSWKRVSTFGFSEFANPEAALRCVRLLNNRQVADKSLLARTDGKMQALVDTYKSEYTVLFGLVLLLFKSYCFKSMWKKGFYHILFGIQFKSLQT